MTISNHRPSMGDSDRRRAGKVEQHINTILTTVAAMLIAFVGKTVWESNEHNARTEVHVQNVMKTADRIEVQLHALEASQYSDNDAKRDLGVVGERLNDLDRRLRFLENGRR